MIERFLPIICTPPIVAVADRCQDSRGVIRRGLERSDRDAQRRRQCSR